MVLKTSVVSVGYPCKGPMRLLYVVIIYALDSFYCYGIRVDDDGNLRLSYLLDCENITKIFIALK